MGRQKGVDSEGVELHYPLIEAGYQAAVCAFSFFRARNNRFPKYKRPGSVTHRGQWISRRRDMVRMCRYYIRKAREAGWRGSILAAATERARQDARAIRD